MSMRCTIRRCRTLLPVRITYVPIDMTGDRYRETPVLDQDAWRQHLRDRHGFGTGDIRT